MLATSFLAFKAETTVGTWATPTFAANALTVRKLDITPFNVTTLKRSIEQPFAGSVPSIPSGIHRGLSFEIELSGSGTANTAVAWAAILNSAMFGTAVPTGTQVGYPLTSAGDGGAASVLALKDTLLHEMTYVRGNVMFKFIEKQTPYLQFDGLGIFRNDPDIYIAGASTGISLASYPAPVEVNLANTVFSIDTFTLGMREFTLDLGMSAKLYTTTGMRGIIFDKDDSKDRRGAKVTAKFELPAPGTKNYSASIIAGTQVALSLTHGITAGNIIQIASSSLLIETITWTEEDNRIFGNITGVLVPTGSTGNNEFTFVTK